MPETLLLQTAICFISQNDFQWSKLDKFSSLTKRHIHNNSLCVFVGFPLTIDGAIRIDLMGRRWTDGTFEVEKTRATYLFLPSRLWLFCRAERRRWCWLCSSDTRAVCSLISSLVLRWCFRTSSFISLYCFLCSRTKPFCCFSSSSVWASNSKVRMEDKVNAGERGQDLKKHWDVYWVWRYSLKIFPHYFQAIFPNLMGSEYNNTIVTLYLENVISTINTTYTVDLTLYDCY